jgi:hypothetical protein
VTTGGRATCSSDTNKVALGVGLDVGIPLPVSFDVDPVPAGEEDRMN